MDNILIFAGTTEGRKLSEWLCENCIEHTVSVATEYGEIVLQESPYANIHMGRMDGRMIRQFILENNFNVVVDATHPYASVVTDNIKSAVEAVNRNAKTEDSCTYMRLRRETDIAADYDDVTYFPDNESCAHALLEIDGNILLTTGSKELSKYCIDQSLVDRLYVRVLPGLESINICVNNGITGKHILALQGPFCTQLNEALIDQFDISCLVTKKSGKAGGWNEKIEAAKNRQIPVYVVGQPIFDEGMSFDEVCEHLLRGEMGHSKKLHITLAGIGMGSRGCMTGDTAEAVRCADILLGAARMIEGFNPRLDKKPYYLAGQIIPYLHDIERKYCGNEINVTILFSGDTGFYSGCDKLYQTLKNEIEGGRLCADVSVMPGISAVSYMAAVTGKSYSDAYICSIHGTKITHLISRISRHEKTFMLMSGLEDMHRLCRLMSEDNRYGLASCTILAGYQLSYPDEEIIEMLPHECEQRLTKAGLYTCIIINPHPISRNITPHISDAEFIRDKVPMTKEEIRHVSICKLHLKSDSVLYDIGSGTGSIAVEAAGLSDDISVYAIEQKETAVSLIEKNIEKAGLENITVIKSKAPEGLWKLPVPTHAFIGGSGGCLRDIIEFLVKRNPQIRIVMNAISLETISEIKEIMASYNVQNKDLVQMQISRSKQLGGYHLMQAENPVWICSFEMGDTECG